MIFEEAMRYLRAGGIIRCGKTTVVAASADTVVLTKAELLSEAWEAQLTDDMILAIWEDEMKLRTDTGQPAQAALLRDCIKLLRTRRL